MFIRVCVFGAVVELPVQLSGVKILQELFQFTWYVHVAEGGKQVHVPETVDCDEREIFFRFTEMVKRMSKLLTIGCEEIY